jgi:hypothetical protein
MPSSVDFNTMSFLCPLVAALRVVCAAMNSRLAASHRQRMDWDRSLRLRLVFRWWLEK